MKLHQIFIYCKNATYTTLSRCQATFSHTLIWCFQHLCEDAIVLILQRRVLRCERAPTCPAMWYGGPTDGWCWSCDHRLGLLLPCREVVFLPIHLPSVDTPSLSLGELAPPSPKWQILSEASPPPTISHSQAPTLSFSMPLLPNLF